MTNYFSQQLDKTFKALSDPTRRAVLTSLAKGPRPMTELANAFKMALPSFSQHLDVLENSGLVKSKKEGRVRTYNIETRQLRVAQDWINKYREMWEQRLAQLEDYLQDSES